MPRVMQIAMAWPYRKSETLSFKHSCCPALKVPGVISMVGSSK